MQRSNFGGMRSSRILRNPLTRLGRLSLVLFAAFFVILWALLDSKERSLSLDRSTFFADPVSAVFLIAAAASAIGAAVVALVAVIFQRERSIAILPVLLLGAFTLVFVVGELLGHH